MVAAGNGVRLAADRPKALVELGGRPLVGWAVAALAPVCDRVVVAAPADHLAAVRAAAPGALVVVGGRERSDSVRAALAVLKPLPEWVLVHDAARPCAPTVVAQRVLAALRAGAQAVIPVLPVPDTIKQVDAAGYVRATPDRAGLRLVQTPQGFAGALLCRAHDGSPDATDDAGLVEALGVPVVTVVGDPRAVKVTTAADLVALTAALA